MIRDMILAREGYHIRAFLDDKYDDLSLQDGVFKGPVSAAQQLLGELEELKFVIAIGNNRTRQAVVSRLNLADACYLTLVHKTAVISPSAQIGQGTVVMANAVIQADAVIGRHAIVNTAAVIEHDNRIGDYVHIAPGATLTGDVKVAEGAMIGAGATVIPGMTVGEWSVIGAGAAVVRPVPPHSTAVGTPAKVISKMPEPAHD